MPAMPPCQPRIAILGAGPAGLSTAWFLKKLGYKDVLVLEKTGRVGGQACTMNSGYKAFDLGANYITPAFWETWKLAWAVGARTYKGVVYTEAFEKGNGLGYRRMTEYVYEDPDSPGKKIPYWRLGLAALKYLRLRWGLRKWIDQPDFRRVKERKDLCIPFSVWLNKNGLGVLERAFQIPITMMGYGFLDEISTVYALKYLSPLSFINLVGVGLPLVGEYFPFPRRFRDGFQRVWQRLSWKLDVRKNVDVIEIRRDPNDRRPIRITFKHPDDIQGDADGGANNEVTLFFDHLVLACPLAEDVLTFMDLSEGEKRLFNKSVVKSHRFSHATVRAVKKGTDQPFSMGYPVLCLTPFVEKTMGRPWAAVQLFPEDTSLIQFYVHMIPEEEDQSRYEEAHKDPRWHEVLDAEGKGPTQNTPKQQQANAFKKLVFERIEELLEKMGAEIAGKREEMDARWISYACWSYFGHVTSEEIAEGYYTTLELQQQGTDNTWYAGGVTNFELIEPIVCYAKALAGRIDKRVREDAQRDDIPG